jgi:hypothetical protein
VVNVSRRVVRLNGVEVPLFAKTKVVNLEGQINVVALLFRLAKDVWKVRSCNVEEAWNAVHFHVAFKSAAMPFFESLNRSLQNLRAWLRLLLPGLDTKVVPGPV